MNAMKSEIVSVEMMDEVTYKVIEIRNLETGWKFYATRKESVEKFQKRTGVSAFAPSSANTDLMQSVRHYGNDNHSYRVIDEFDDKTTARKVATKLAIIASRSKAGGLNKNKPIADVDWAELFDGKAPKWTEDYADFRDFKFVRDGSIEESVTVEE